MQHFTYIINKNKHLKNKSHSGKNCTSVYDKMEISGGVFSRNDMTKYLKYTVCYFTAKETAVLCVKSPTSVQLKTDKFALLPALWNVHCLYTQYL